VELRGEARHGIRVVVQVARNPICGPGLLYDLVTHVPPVQKAYRVVAAHPNADAATLLRCLRDDQARPVAARHPALPAAANPSLPRAAIGALLTAGG
jgi:hypothetical protein